MTPEEHDAETAKALILVFLPMGICGFLFISFLFTCDYFRCKGF